MRIGIWLKIVTEVVFHFILYVSAIIEQLVRNVHLAALKERDLSFAFLNDENTKDEYFVVQY